MAKSVRQKVYEAALARLEQIQRASGYNTQPLVCAHQTEAWSALESVAIWVVWGSEEFGLDDRTVGGGQSAVCTLLISAYVRKDAGNLIVLMEQALQDVRNAMESSYADWQTNCGATLRSLDMCETDQGEIAHEGRAMFTQPFVFEYRGGPTW